MTAGSASGRGTDAPRVHDGVVSDGTVRPHPGAAPPAAAIPVVDVHGVEKPLLRGRIHAAAFFAAVPAGIYLVSAASGLTARVGAGIYAACLLALLGASSSYHRFGRPGRSQEILRRLDHSSIYLLIAGSYTPLCLLAFPGRWGFSLLAGVWAAAAVGVVLKLTRFDRSHTAGFVLYLAMGWAVVIAAPALVSSLDASTLVLLVGGGVVYSVGAVVLATRFPNPLPRVFGYHEVWHLMVVVAVALHYAAIHDVVTSA